MNESKLKLMTYQELYKWIEDGDETKMRLAEAEINRRLTNQMITQSRRLNLITIVLVIVAIIQLITSIIILLK